MGSFLMGAKHKFYLNRLGSVSSLCLLFFQTEIFPTHTQDRMIKLHTHISAVLLFQICSCFKCMKQFQDLFTAIYFLLSECLSILSDYNGVPSKLSLPKYFISHSDLTVDFYMYYRAKHDHSQSNYLIHNQNVVLFENQLVKTQTILLYVV